jgi:hypothetical protein
MNNGYLQFVLDFTKVIVTSEIFDAAQAERIITRCLELISTYDDDPGLD